MTTINKTYDAKIAEYSANGKTKAAIEGWLQFEHNLSVNESKSAVQRVLGKGATNKGDWSQIVTYVRENYGKIDKKDLIAGMCEVSGQKTSSMNHAYNYIKFAIEYARQELEAIEE